VTPGGELRVLYFAWLRERAGTGEETVAPPETVSTVGDLVAWLRERSPGHAAAFARPELIRCAVNQDFAGHQQALHAGDEVAFFPPVTGG
jgi:molybdopterin synthase sulfur carrier subunit